MAGNLPKNKYHRQNAKEMEKRRQGFGFRWAVAKIPFKDGIELNTDDEHRMFIKEGADEIFSDDAHSPSIMTYKDLNILDYTSGEIEYLEVGIGFGGDVAYLAKRSKGNFTGIDLLKEICDFVDEKIKVNNIDNLKIINVSIEEAEFEENSFDFISASHLLEHVSEPIKILETLKKWLKPGGKLLIATPNVEAFHPRVFGIEAWRHASGNHVWLPGKTNLTDILKEDLEFKIIKRFTYGGFYPGSTSAIKRFGNYLLKKFGLGDAVVFLLEK